MKLKLCPFCGGKAHLIITEAAHCIECSGCLASSKVVYSLMEDGTPLVVEAWNRRQKQKFLKRKRVLRP